MSAGGVGGVGGGGAAASAAAAAAPTVVTNQVATEWLSKQPRFASAAPGMASSLESYEYILTYGGSDHQFVQQVMLQGIQSGETVKPPEAFVYVAFSKLSRL